MARRSVDLPQPDGPMSETNSPGAMSRSTPSSARVGTPSAPAQVFATPRRRTTGAASTPGSPFSR